MVQIEIGQKPLSAVRLAARTAVVSGQPEVPGVVGPLFDEVRSVRSVPGGVRPCGV